MVWGWGWVGDPVPRNRRLPFSIGWELCPLVVCLFSELRVVD